VIVFSAPQWESVQEAPRQTIRRRLDEPKLEIGQTISIKEGVVGVVLARYMPSGGKGNYVCYVVELVPSKHRRADE
jgi:hypothetical protein